VGSPLTRIALLGSTGSIGRQTLDVVRAHPQRFSVTALAAGRNVELLAEQVREFRPSMVYCERPEELKPLLGENLPQLMSPTEMVVQPEVDVVMSAIVGKGGLEPALAAAKAGKAVALANKEAMVMAGGLMKQAAREGGGELRPVDSEHSAIWQCLAGEDASCVRKLIITASGGALRDLPLSELAEVGPAEALAHPNWSMGQRITIDSATLFNKGLEVIEAHWLFDVPYAQIEVLLHRESIIHSMVEMVDGSFKAHLSFPDMRQPIQFALTYPERLPLELPVVDFARMGSLNFGELDRDRYPCLNLVLEAGARGDTYPAALAAADEEAVAAFLDGRLRFLDIPRLLADTLERHNASASPSLEAIMEADAWARDFARAWMKDR
jgi:1-deoxy-D-xylulose-5-phosphate reductoisomerase